MGCSVSTMPVESKEREGKDDVKAPESFFSRISSSFGILGSKHSRDTTGTTQQEETPKLVTVSMEQRQVEKLSYPNPSPPKDLKADIFTKENFAQVDNYARKVPVSMMFGTLKSLTKRLTSPYRTDTEKVRSLFTWVTSLNIEKLQFCLAELPDRKNTPLEILLRIHWKIGNHAHFFAQLCRSVGIPCVQITGISKGMGYNIGKRLDRRAMLANWNAVFIEGDWRFIDVHLAVTLLPSHKPSDWSAGDEKISCELGSSRGFPAVNEAFFLTNPEQMIHMNMPNDPNWQLLENPITQDEFEQSAFLRERYFEFGMQLSVPSSSNGKFIQTVDGHMFLEFDIPEHIAKHTQFSYAMSRHKKGGSSANLPLDKYVLYQKGQDFIRFQAKLPVKGRFKFDIFGKDDEKHDEYDLCASYMIECDYAQDHVEPFPDSPANGWGLSTDAANFGLKSKSHEDAVIDNVDGKIEVHFYMEYRVSVLHSLKSNSIPESELKRNVMVREDRNELVVTVRLQKEGEYALALYVNERGKTGPFQNVCNYLLRCYKDTEQTLFPRIHEGTIGEGFYADQLGVHPVNHILDKIHTPWIHTHSGRVTIEFESEDETNIEMQCELQNNELDNYLLSECVTVVSEGQYHIFQINLPHRGEYAFNIYGRKKNYDQFRVFHAFSYLITSTQTVPRNNSLESQRKVDIQPHPVIGDTTVIRIPAGKKVQKTELVQMNVNSDVDHLVEHKCGNEKNVYRVHLPECGEYRFDIYDDNSDGTLSHCMHYDIIRREPEPGEPEDVVEEGFEELSEEERHKLVENSKVVAEHNKYRGNMRHAMALQDHQVLRRAIREFEEHDIPSLDGDLNEAWQLLDFLHIDEELSEAMQARELPVLEHILESAEHHEIQEKLGLKLVMGCRIRDQIVRLAKLRHDVLRLEHKLIMEIRAYKKPPQIMQKVMTATFILLGVEERNLKVGRWCIQTCLKKPLKELRKKIWSDKTSGLLKQNWKSIKSFMHPARKDNLKRQIAEFKLDSIPLEAAHRAKRLLSKITLADVRNVNETGVVFYMWNRGVIEEAEAQHSYKKLDALGAATELTDAKKKKRRNKQYI